MKLALLCFALLCLGLHTINAARLQEDGWSQFVDAKHQATHKMMLEQNLVPDRAELSALVPKRAQEKTERAPISSTNPLRIAFVLNSALNDLGWAFNHNTGRIEVEKEFGDLVATKVFEGIGDDQAKANDFFFHMLNVSNFDFIIGCTYIYQFPMFTLAEQHPDKSFLAVSGYLSASNFGTLGSSQLYQPRYLSGLVAGSLTKNNRVGHIATFPIWDIFLQANALFIGLRQVNPDAQLTITMLESWFNEDLEAFQTNILFDEHDVDVMSQASNSNPPQFITSNRGGISIGLNTDASEFVSQSVVVSVRNIWGTIYKEATYLVMNNDFASYQDLWLPISSGAVDISEFSVRVDQTLADMVTAERQNLIDGKRIFCGQWAAPFVNFTSVPDDYCLSDAQLQSMDKFFDEIVFVGHPTIPTTYLQLSDGLLIAMQVLAALALVVLITYFVLILVYRDTNMIKFGSPLFCAVSMIGAVLMVIVVFLISPQPPTTAVCNASVWLLCIGFGTFFAPIIVKTARTFLLFRSVEKFRVSVFPLSNLLIAIAVILIFEVLFLILFTAIETPTTNKVLSDTDKYAYYVYCNYSGANVILLYVLVAFNALLILICIIATFLTRRVTTNAFNETAHLTIVIYIAAFIFVILMPLYVIVDSDTSRYLIACLGIIIGNVVASSAYLIPKFYIIWRGKDHKHDPLKRSTARTSSEVTH